MDGGLRDAILLWSCSDLSACAPDRDSISGCRLGVAHGDRREARREASGETRGGQRSGGDGAREGNVSGTRNAPNENSSETEARGVSIARDRC